MIPISAKKKLKLFFFVSLKLNRNVYIVKCCLRTVSMSRFIFFLYKIIYFFPFRSFRSLLFRQSVKLNIIFTYSSPSNDAAKSYVAIIYIILEILCSIQIIILFSFLFTIILLRKFGIFMGVFTSVLFCFISFFLFYE